MYFELILGAILVVLIPLAISTTLLASKVEAAWYSDNWLYRKPITITHNAAVSNNKVKFDIDTTDAPTKIQADCDDIRFTDVNGKVLRYYFDSATGACDTSSSDFYVLVPTIINGTTVVYMYYGNPYAPAGTAGAQLSESTLAPSGSYSVGSEEKTTGPTAYWKFDDKQDNFTSSYNNADTTTGLVAYWNLDETAANSCTGGVNDSCDSTSNASNGAWSGNATTTTTAKYGSAVTLDGTGDYVDLGSSTIGTDLNGASQMTVSAWIKPNTYPGAGLRERFVQIFVGDSLTGVLVSLNDTTGNIEVGGRSVSGDSFQSTTSDVISTSAWTHVVGILDIPNDQISIYINGALKKTASVTFTNSTYTQGSPGATDHDAIGGLYQDGTITGEIDGNIDDVRVYNRALNGEQINTLASSPMEATLVNGPTWQTEDQCIAGKCYKFDGTNDYATVPGVVLPTVDFSYSLWTKLFATSNEVLFFLGNGIGNEFFIEVEDGNNFKINVNGADLLQSATTTIDTNTWYHIEVTRASNIVTLYMNGKAIGTVGESTTLDFGTCGVILGADANSGCSGTLVNYANALIDEVKIYNYARSGSQVAMDYQSRGGAEGPGTVLGTDAQNQPAALSNGLTAYWKMDETSWTVNCSTASVIDSSGNGNNGTACPNTTGPSGGSTTAKFGYAGSFDGSNDYVNVADSSSLNPTNAITLSAWIKTSAGSDRYILTKHNDSFYIAVGVVTANKFEFYLNGVNSPSWISSTTSVNDNAWHLVTATYDGTTRSVYVDGKLEASVANTGSISTGTASLLIGQRKTSPGEVVEGNPFSGNMDEVRIYNRALSPTDVSNLYNFAPGPVGYWKMDETKWSNDCNTTSVIDSSGYGNNGRSCPAATGSTGNAVGKVGKAGDFDNTEDYVEIPNATSMNINTAMTAEFWIKADILSDTDLIISKRDSSSTEGSYQINVINSSGNMGFCFVKSGPTFVCRNSTNALVSTGTWTHITLVHTWGSGTNTAFYKNGVPQTMDAWSGGTGDESMATNSNVTRLGYSANAAGSFDGLLDEAKIYNYARSTKQITEDMNANHPAPGSPVGSPVGYWKFDQGVDNTCSGGTNDACNSGNTGSTLDGAQSGMATPATSTSGWTNSGKFGKGLSFDDSNDLVSIADHSSLDVSSISDHITISAWVKTSDAGPADDGGDVIMEKNWTGGVPTGWIFEILSSGFLDFRISNGTTTEATTGTTAINDGNWHHVAAVADGTTNYIYLDGRLEKTKPRTSLNASNAQSAGIGGRAVSSAFHWNGQIDEVKFYTGALTASQVTLDYNRGSGQTLGALGDNTTYQKQAANQEYCVPGDTASCVAPVGEWKFEEGTGTTTYDTSGNGFNGTLTNGPTWTRGKFGKAIDYDGSNDVVRVSDTSTLEPSGDMTVEAWVKFDTLPANDMKIVRKVDTTVGSAYELKYESGDSKIYFVWTQNDAGPTYHVVASYTTVTTGQWYHILGVRSGTSINTYLNAIPNSTPVTTAGSLHSSDSFLDFGSNTGSSEALDGQIDNVRIYNYARSAAQIAWEYNNGKPVAHWKMDECQGTTINDSAGNSLAGTLTIGASGTQTSAGTCTTSATTPWYTGRSGKLNYSLNFDGTDDYVLLADPASGLLDFGTNNFSLAFWIKTTKATRFDPITKVGSGANPPGYGFYWSSASSFVFTTFNAGTNSNVDWTTPNNINDGNWHHIIGVKNGTTQQIYRDGQLVATQTGLTSVNVSSNGDFCVAKHCVDNNFFVSGQMDDFRAYNYDLTESQIKTLYGGGAVRYAPASGAP